MCRPDIIPIAIREDFIVRVHVPLDLTKAEAEKVGRVVVAWVDAELEKDR